MSFKVKALYEYASGHDDDLPFGIGQIITVTEEVDGDWYSGEYIDDAGTKQEGMFPCNFVEKYEPVAPPRPTRTRPKKESEPAAEEPVPVPAAAVEEPTPAPATPIEPPQESTPISSPPQRTAEPVSPASPPASKPAEPVLPSSPIRASTEPVVQSPPKPALVKRGPPPVTEKPAGVTSSFKDRIAAFNKSSAPPVTPFKPSGLGGAGGSSSFIKKPFVAPPPKGNTYVPAQRNAPIAPVYRREEDPEIKEREAENTENAQKAGLLPSENKEAEEDEPKPLSLKERMALLQRQQQEQATRHAEAAAKREKPKRPATKPRMLSNESAGAEGVEDDDAAAPVPLERRDTGETSGKPSLDEARPPRVPAQPRRKPSLDPEPRDGNEADMSGAGETTDNQDDDLTEREDSDKEPHRPARQSTSGYPVAAEEGQADDDEEEGEEEEEEDEETAELRRKEELRARMARLGGGMGMPGMFGMPMPGAGAPSLPPKKKKPTISTDKPRTSEDSPSVTSPRAPPVPTMMALPGMGGRSKQAEEEPAIERAEDEEPVARSPPAG